MGATEKWSIGDIANMMALPFPDLLYAAQTTHREHWDCNEIQTSKVFNIKRGLCPEDCSWCAQSVHNKVNIEKNGLLDVEEILAEAKRVKANGSTRFCMAAAWRGPKDKDMDQLIEIINAIRDLGMQTCMSLGALSDEQVKRLDQAGLDYYNHNIESSKEHFEKMTTTRSYEGRIETVKKISESNICSCSGGIMGMGETREDRVKFLHQLANLPKYPDSVPLNILTSIEGTPLSEIEPLDSFEFVRVVATARILMPKAYLRFSCGRQEISEECQALCYLAGINSIHWDSGDGYLTNKTEVPTVEKDKQMFVRLGIKIVPQKDIKPREVNEPVCA